MRCLTVGLGLFSMGALGTPSRAQTPARHGLDTVTKKAPIQSLVPAGTLMASALARAKAENKGVLVRFDASWCGACKSIERFLHAPEVEPIMSKYYINLPLTIWEMGRYVPLNTPGADSVFQALQLYRGMPMYAFLNAQGQTLANSNVIWKDSGDRRGTLGYPSQEASIAAFSSKLRTATPKMTDAELDQIVAYLKSVGKKQKPVGAQDTALTPK